MRAIFRLCVLTFAGAVAFASPALPAAPTGGLEGGWTAEQAAGDGGAAKEAALTFTSEGGSLTGVMRAGAGTGPMPLFDVREMGTNVSFTIVIPGTPYISIHYVGVRTGDEIRLVGSDESHTIYTLTARRVVAAPPAAPLVPTPTPVAATPAPAQTQTASLQPPPAPAPVPALRPAQTESPARAPVGNLDGNWTAEQVSPNAAPADATLTFTRNGTALTGLMRTGSGPGAGSEETPLFEVRQAGDSVSFTRVIQGTPYVTVNYSGTLKDDQLTLASGDNTYRLTAHRVGAAAPLQVALPPQVALLNSPPPLPQARATIPSAPASGRIDGVWTAEQASPGSAAPVRANLVFTGNRGTMHVGADDWPLFDVRDTGTNVAFTLVIPGTPYITIHYDGTIDGDVLQLASLDEGQGVFHLNARRAAAASPAPATPLQPAAQPQPRVALLNPQPSSPGSPPKLALPALHDVPPNNLAKTPPMGWASRGKLGTDIEDDAIRQAAESFEETGLREAGYAFVEVDEGWQGTRDASGVLHANTKFPDMKALADYVHSKRLKFGLQVSAAPKSCGGFEGSYDHEAADARTFASWGVDTIVYDWCGAESLYTTQAEQQAANQKMSEALRASGRDIVFGISPNGAFDVAPWGAKTGANLWRTGRDVEDKWQSVSQAGFAQNGKEAFAGPGRWNDPGLIQAGNGGMTPDEYRSQLNLWAVLAAPMMLGNDVRIMTKDTLATLSNQEVIAIDQDTLGRQGKRVAQNGQSEVWARPLADGSLAVAFFNRSDQSAPVAVSWQQLGIDGPRRVRDLWWHENLGTANGRYVVFLNAHTSLLLRVSR